MATDVFISYSRKDIDFARRLSEMLEKAGRNTWIDFDDIPYSVDWLEEIKQGIAAANTFVFVISPDSLASRVCHVELDYARQNNKRIVPLLRREVNADALQTDWKAQDWGESADQNWTSLKRLNWLFFRDSDDFEHTFQSLSQTVDQDPEYIRGHSRLLVRAQEWDTHKRNRSYLLGGADLSAAESWLVQSVNLEPRPTALHTTYIQTSRQNETRRTRNLLLGVSTALVVTVTLAVLAFSLFQQSEVNRVLAEGNEATAVYRGQVSDALRLAAQADVEAQGNFPDRGVLLALQAVEHYPHMVQGEQALATAVTASHLRFLFNGGDVFINDQPWSADETMLATFIYSETTADRTLYVQDLNTREAVFQLVAEEADWSPTNPDWMAVGLKGTVTIWDVRKNSPVAEVPGGYPLWSLDGKQLSTREYMNGDSTTVWDAATGQKRFSLDTTALQWSPDGKYLFGPSKILYDAYMGAVVPLADQPMQTSTENGCGDTFGLPIWMQDSKHVLWLQRFGYCIYDVETGESEPNLSVYSPDDAAFSPNGQYLLFTSNPNNAVLETFFLFRRTDGIAYEITNSINASAAGFASPGSGSDSGDLGNFPLWSPDSNYLTYTTIQGTVIVSDNLTLNPKFEFHLYGTLPTDAPQSVWSPSGHWLAAIANKAIHIWEIKSVQTPPITLAAASDTSSDGRFHIEGQMAGREVSELDVIDRLSPQIVSFPPVTLVWAPHSNRLAAEVNNEIQVWDFDTGQIMVTIPLDAGQSLEGWLADGTGLVVDRKLTEPSDNPDAPGYVQEVLPAWESLDALIQYAHTCCVVRDLTPDERTQYNLPSA